MQSIRSRPFIKAWYTPLPASLGLPRTSVDMPCGSKSMRRVRRFLRARLAERLMAVVVLPTPPFWLATAMTLFIVRPVFTWNRGLGQALFPLDLQVEADILDSRRCQPRYPPGLAYRRRPELLTSLHRFPGQSGDVAIIEAPWDLHRIGPRRPGYLFFLLPDV